MSVQERALGLVSDCTRLEESWGVAQVRCCVLYGPVLSGKGGRVKVRMHMSPANVFNLMGYECRKQN